ncbi:MAG: tripartite tricarboxylate transporter substrate binding protein [Burkholderiaceae bacterium]|jgi:tripartite-type tricarboxylate transporter receptor subunit TctC|nr:tripartite tricarboxylate transporter substrate binding protein [Burkholderiaceae bacterium]
MNAKPFQPLSRRALLLGLAAFSAGWTLPAQAADDWPSRPIRLIVPFSPGGATDVVARLVSQKLGEALKQSVVIENRSGASGMIGTEAVARAAPDGYTLLLNSAGAQTLSPVLYKANYDSLKSFAPVSLIANIGFVMVVNPKVPAASVKEFVALARSGKRPMSFAGGSSLVSLIGEQFKITIGAPEMVNVQYKGTGPQMQAVVGGEVDMTIDPFNSLEMIRAGKLRALAVFSEKRSPSLPDVPTMKEQGFDMVFNSWAALLAPAGTPPAIVQRLHTEIAKIVALPEVREQLARIDYEPIGGTPEQLATLIADDTARWRKIVKDTKFMAEP